MRLSARVQKLENAEPRCDPNRFRLAPEATCRVTRTGARGAAGATCSSSKEEIV